MKSIIAAVIKVEPEEVNIEEINSNPNSEGNSNSNINIKTELEETDIDSYQLPSSSYTAPIKNETISKTSTSKGKWQLETVKHLVSLYELQPLLYNVNSPAYHNKMSRNVAVETIANELLLKTKIKFTTDEVVKKLNSLRTQFLNVERNRKKGPPSGSGSCSTSKPSWWLYESLQFLLPFTKKDRGDTNLKLNKISESPHMEEPDLKDDVSNTLSNTVESTIESDEQPCQYYCLSPDPESSRVNSPSPSLSSQEPNLSTPLKRKRSAKKKPVHEEILRDTLEKLVDKKEDPIDLFTAWIGSEMKEIKNKQIIKKLKRKIINLIQEVQDEEESL